jgi:hypothetical protein
MSALDASATPVSSTEATRLASIEARLLAYHDVRFSVVLNAIAYLRDPGDSVIAGGSLTVGLGNRLSDLDIVVSGQANAESSRVPFETWLGTLRIDVWKFSCDAIAELVQRAEGVLAHDAPVDGAFGDNFEEADLKLLHRLAFGVTVDGAPLQPKASRPYPDIAGDLLAREYAERMRSAAFVTQLALLAGDRFAAAFNARLAVHSALHATVYTHRLPFTGDKWLRERLTHDASDLLDIHDAFAVLPEDLTDAERFARDAVQACAQLANQDLSLRTLAPQVGLDAADIALYQPGNEHFLVLTKRDCLWDLDDSQAIVWGRIHPDWIFDADDPPALTLAYELYAVGAARLRWQRGLPITELAFDQKRIS